MALDFGGHTNQYDVDCGNPNSWNWGAGAGTLIAWFYPDSTGQASYFPTIISKSGASAQNTRLLQAWQDQDELVFLIGSGVDALRMESANNTLTGSQWWFVAVVWEPGAGDTAQKMYLGDLDSIISEVSYTEQSDGSSLHDSSSDNLMIGIDNSEPAASPFDGKIAYAAGWNGVKLSQAQLAIAQFKPWLIPTLGPGNLEFYIHLGIHGSGGTGTQRDWSGNGYNGTVTSATKSDHVPIPIFPLRTWMPPFPAAAVVPEIGAAHHYQRLYLT